MLGKLRVAVIFPSRGLVFSKTAEEMLECLRTVPHKIFFSHRRPIPDCFEIPLNEALEHEDNFTHFWFIEDDMILPPNIFWDIYDPDTLVAACDYPVTKDGKGAVFYDGTKTPIFTGTGCLLVKREVLEKLEKPYFRADIRWTPFNYGKTVKLTGSMHSGDGYGLHDVTFGIKLYKSGIPITVVGKLGQRKLISLGKQGTNKGAHKTEEWKKIKSNYQLHKILSQPIALGAKGSLVTVETPTGGIRVSKKHADNLIKQGLASAINEKQIIIDDSEVQW